MDKSFVMFGCWNNVNTKNGKQIGCLQNVMEKLNTFIRTHDIPNIIVAGDNYYPDKIEVDGTKQKKIIVNKLIKGFKLLPKDVNIDMIFGNHDLESNQGDANDNLYVMTDDNSEMIKEDANCEIIKYELQSLPTNVNLKLFQVKQINDNTIVILLDTSIYTADAPEFMKCYNYFLQLTQPGMSFNSVEQLKESQETTIITTLIELFEKNKDNIKNIIIAGHHPISGLKTKEKKGKLKVVEMDDIIDIIPFLHKIYKIIGEKKYYYLCADYHSYQEGTITLNLENDKHMIIEQYIVGTGGTKLDLDLPNDVNTNYSTNELTYNMKINKQDCGFLVCNAQNENLIFTPILLKDVESVRTGGRTKKRRNKKKKTRKRIKRSY
jgi:metallophosphoesterase superfamily enzyme